MSKLLAKSFPVDQSKIDARFRKLGAIGYDGIFADGEDFIVQWTEEANDAEMAKVELYWRNLTQTVYNTPTAQEADATLAAMYDEACKFGKRMIVQYALSNIQTGITQARKTRAVAKYCMDLVYYMKEGSLYAAIEEIEEMLEDHTGRVGLDPWLSDARLSAALAEVKAFLKIT